MRDCYARRIVADAGKDEGGLLGDLPSHRPSVRSPRRKSPAGGEKPRATASRASAEDTPLAPEQRPSTAGQIARAGAGLAAGPARLGLRLVGRTVDGLGKAVGRR